MPLQFRPALMRDTHRIVELVNSAYRGDSGKQGWTTEADLLGGQRTDAEDIAGLIQSPQTFILLGEMEGRLAGSVYLERHEAGAYLGMLAVHPALQSQGLGKRMIAKAEQFAMTEWAAEKMLMTVITLRHDIIAFYQRLGYGRTGRLTPFPDSERYGIPKVSGLVLEYLEKPLALPRQTVKDAETLADAALPVC